MIELNDRRFADDLLRIVDERIARSFERLALRVLYGIVDSVDTSTRKCSVFVYGNGTSSPGFTYGEHEPLAGDAVAVAISADGARMVLRVLGRDIASGGSGASTAADVAVVDALSRFTGTDVETVLTELQPLASQPYGSWYDFSSSTSSADPGSGRFRLNNATLSSVTALYISETDLNGLSRAALIATWDDAVATTRGTLYINSDTDASKWARYAVTGAITDNGSWVTVPLTHIASGTTPADGDDCRVFFVPSSVVSMSTSFPSSPATNQRHFRTDLGMEFYYDGTRWVTAQLFTLNAAYNGSANQQAYAASTDDQDRFALALPTGYSNIWLHQIATAFRVLSGGTALGASHKWVGTFTDKDGGTVHATQNIDSGASVTARQLVTTVDALLGADPYIDVDWTKTGTPGNLMVLSTLYYRLVAT